MLAILEIRRAEQIISTEASQLDYSFELSTGVRLLEIMRSLVALPEGFLCEPIGRDAETVSFLYEKIFSRSPLSVIKEALEVVAEKASVDKAAKMSVQQLSIAIKQMSVEHSLSNGPDNLMNRLRLEVTIELIRIHIANEKSNQSSVPANALPLLMTPLLRHYLETPISSVMSAAQLESSEAIESLNSMIKPYLKQLAALKKHLTY